VRYCDIRIGDRKLWDRSAELFADWSKFCTNAGEDAGSQKGLTTSLLKLGCQRFKATDGSRGIRFIRLRLEKEDRPSAGHDFNRAGPQRPQSNFG
jgi:hypothetical protein